MFEKIKNITLRTLVFLLSSLFFLTGCTTAPAPTAGTVASAGTSASSTATSATTSAQVIPEVPKKKVALTFDDGPHREYTIGILNELKKYGFHATFFVVGNRVDGTAYSGGSALAEAIAGGHEVAIHGYTHTAYYNSCSDEKYAQEINKTVEAIKGVAPEYDVKLMRPIGGSISNERVTASPYSIILWNVDSEDWKQKYSTSDSANKKAAKLEKIVDNVMSNVDEGSIILMHDIYESTYDAVKIILARLNAEGYEVVTVSELLGDPQPGTKYTKKD